MHNYRLRDNDDLLDENYQFYINMAPVFTRGDTDKLAAFIAKYIKKGNPDVLYHIENGRIIPSKSLQDNLLSMLKGNKEFVLIDDQKVIYEKAITIANKLYNQKTSVYCSWRTWNRKNGLAINILVAILNL